MNHTDTEKEPQYESEADHDTGTESEVVDGNSDADTTFEANDYELAGESASEEEEEEEKFDFLTLMDTQCVAETQLDEGALNTEADDTGTETEVDGNSDADTTFEASNNEPIDVIELLMAGPSGRSKTKQKHCTTWTPSIDIIEVLMAGPSGPSKKSQETEDNKTKQKHCTTCTCFEH